MATRKFIIEVEEGKTYCDYCPLVNCNYICKYVTDGRVIIDCDDYNLATMKITEYNEPTCYNLQCLGRNPHKMEEEK